MFHYNYATSSYISTYFFNIPLKEITKQDITDILWDLNVIS